MRLCRPAGYLIFAASDLNELVSHNYVTTFMKIKGFPFCDAISRDGNFVSTLFRLAMPSFSLIRVEKGGEE